MDPTVAERVAQLYDVSVSDWPGELDFYHRLTAEVKAAKGAVLELACGTGRVTLRLAQDGVRLVGLDASPAMLAAAQAKSTDRMLVRWVEGDMRSFELGETYKLVIMPGHSFQHILTPTDQLACLTCIQRHLGLGGMLVIHLDQPEIDWLGELCLVKKGVFEDAGELVHPQTGARIRIKRAWSYEPLTQTASSVTVWEELGPDGQIHDRWEMGPLRLHCVFRFEMEHLLARAGFTVEAMYGDFFRNPLTDESRDMIWVARKSRSTEH